MANDLKDVKSKTRALLGDPLGDWATDAYLIPLINLIYEDSINYLMNTCSPFMTKKVFVPNVMAGTTDLTSWQATPQTGAQAAGQQGAFLLGLVTPLEIYWKVEGQPENNYRLADEKKDLPFITPANYINGQNLYWEWIGNRLNVTPLSFPSDWLVKGEFKPPPLLLDADYVQIDSMMTSALAYATAATAGGERINATYIQNWGSRATMALDDISARLVRKEQSTPQRLGRYSGRGGRGRGR